MDVAHVGSRFNLPIEDLSQYLSLSRPNRFPSLSTESKERRKKEREDEREGHQRNPLRSLDALAGETANKQDILGAFCGRHVCFVLSAEVKSRALELASSTPLIVSARKDFSGYR